jgi:hypothetical protein
VGGLLWPGLSWRARGAALPWTVLRLAEVSIWLQQMEARHWDELAAAYPDELEALRTLWGQEARARYPQVAVQRGRGGGLCLGDEARYLRLETGEPVRTPHGWGGARIAVARPGDRPHRPALLLLTFARGWHPEWLATSHHLLEPSFVLVDAPFVRQTLDAVFRAGPPETSPAASPDAKA